jgi:hypothetical protein
MFGGRTCSLPAPVVGEAPEALQLVMQLAGGMDDR